MPKNVDDRCNNGCIWDHRGGSTPLQCVETADTISCGIAALQEANISPIHDAALAAATKKINKILTAIPPSENGLGASIIHTGSGYMLARVKHGARPTKKKTVNQKSDPATIAKTLGLK